MLGDHAITAATIDLQGALEALEMRDRPIGFAVGGVDIRPRLAGRLRPRAIITRVSPELAGLGASASRIEHGCRRLVGEQLGRTLEQREQAFVHRP
jgi:hypothetical protein